MISIQTEDFDAGREYEKLVQAGETGAVVTFVGRVREFDNRSGEEFYLEHYPGMTENVLQKIESNACQRWQLQQTCIIHRVGSMKAGDQIVFVGVSSTHRKQAFEACEYIIDILKTQAPFWKKEGNQWVAANEADNDAADKWLTERDK